MGMPNLAPNVQIMLSDALGEELLSLAIVIAYVENLAVSSTLYFRGRYQGYSLYRV